MKRQYINSTKGQETCMVRLKLHRDYVSAFRHSGATHSRPNKSKTPCSVLGKNILESYRRVLVFSGSASHRGFPRVTHIPELSNFIALQ